MDTKTKIQVIISIVMVTLIGLLTYWIQLPADDVKAQLLDENQTILVRIKDFSFEPDVVRIEKDTVVSWLNDETDANAGVQHTVSSYNPEDTSMGGELFESDLLSQGDTFTYKFEDEGVYNYNCTLHPFMTGKVCVGAASEEEDDDCAIDETVPEEALGGNEETLDENTAEEETALNEEEDILLTDEDTPPSLTLPPPEELPEEEGLPETDLNPASDEDYKPTGLGGTEDTGLVLTSGTAQKDQYPKTANSGPEDFVYLLAALAAVIGAKKVLAKTSR